MKDLRLIAQKGHRDRVSHNIPSLSFSLALLSFAAVAVDRAASEKSQVNDTAATPHPRPWLNATLPIPARVAALLPLLSQTEKLWQLQRAGVNDASLAETGIGLLECGSLSSGARLPSDVAAARNAFVSTILSSGPGARLGIPPAFRTLATHGGEAFGTVFPQGPGVGASWDTPLAAAIAAASAAEARALGIDLTTFVIHMVSDGRFGRQEEGFSEEPTLTAAMGVACVLGAQGSTTVAADDYLLPPHAPALFKHVGAYGAPAGGLNHARADAPEHTVREVFLKPWRLVAGAGARGVMPSHNTLLNTPAHASQWLLSDVLRHEMGMAGIFLSDTGDVTALRNYRLCDDDASCAALAITAGVDVEQPPGQTFLSLPDALTRGLVNQSTIDDAVARVLSHKFSAGLFDTPLVNASAADDVVNSPAHRALALQAAEEGCVLLVNRDAALPLARGKHVAVIGPLGNTTPPLLGNYVGTGPYPLTGVQTVFAAINASGYAAYVTFAQGASVGSDDVSGIPAALAAARTADAIILVLGDDLTSCGESIDRDDLDLPGSQLPLLAALVAAKLPTPIIVVLINGRTATFGAADGNALLEGVDALLVAWRPGQEGGAAIANLLWGVTNPSGRLPNQWLSSVGKVGAGSSPWLQERVADWGGDVGAEGRGYGSYWHAKNPTAPLFVFGAGLSYGVFTVTNLIVTHRPGDAATPFVAQATVSLDAGVGATAGSCVVQLYVQDPVGARGRIVAPWKRLLAFTRVSLTPGKSVVATLPIAAADLAIVDASMVFRVVPGTYIVSVGTNSADDHGPGQVVAVDVA